MKWSESQTLITGVYRTGTEYLTHLVNSHPEVSASMYSVNVPRFIQGKYNPIAEQDNYMRALTAIRERLIQRYEKSIDVEALGSALAQAGEVTYEKLYDLVMSKLYLSGEKRHWAEKNQLLWREIPKFIDNMPNGKAVLVIRDPRSVLVSFKNFTYAPAPAYLGAVFNCLDAMLHAIHYASKLPSNRFLLLRYEDIAVEPQSTANQVWRLIGAETGFDVKSSNRWLDAYGKPWHANSSFHAQVNLKPFDIVDSINRWRGKITDFELGLTELICGELMEIFGYDRHASSQDWLGVFRKEISDSVLMSYLDHWLATGQGIQAFPTDPVKPENWRNE